MTSSSQLEGRANRAGTGKLLAHPATRVPGRVLEVGADCAARDRTMLSRRLWGGRPALIAAGSRLPADPVGLLRSNLKQGGVLSRGRIDSRASARAPQLQKVGRQVQIRWTAEHAGGADEPDFLDDATRLPARICGRLPVTIVSDYV